MIPALLQHNPHEPLVRITNIPSPEAGAVLLDHPRTKFQCEMGTVTIPRNIDRNKSRI